MLPIARAQFRELKRLNAEAEKDESSRLLNLACMSMSENHFANRRSERRAPPLNTHPSVTQYRCLISKPK